MTTQDLKDRIQNLVRDIVAQKKNPEQTKDVSTKTNFEIINKFPKLHEVLVELLTEDYGLFIENVLWVAPKPATFRIVLKNNQYFFLINTERTWIAQVEGKKFYLLNISEEERAIKAIARLLRYGYQELPSETEAKATEPTPLTPSELPAELPPPSETPAPAGELAPTTPEEEIPPLPTA